MNRTVRIIGTGRAGGSFAAALADTDGWDVVDVHGRGADLTEAAQDCALVLICTPDKAVASVAAEILAGPAVVAHVAGSLGMGVLRGHEHQAGIHPLMALPTPAIGARRLQSGGWFGVAGDAVGRALVRELVSAFGGNSAIIADEHRASYHAAAAVAANHVVVLLAQVERLAADAGMPIEGFIELTRGSLGDVAELGAVAALTGPAARGDLETLDAHRAVMADRDRALYDTLADEAQRLAAEGNPR